jgi:hypothetical protein
MRGLDGNYINTQGDASAKMQVVYQAEQDRQQMRAQLEASDALRKLREQVNETEKEGASGGTRTVQDDQGSNSGQFASSGDSDRKSGNQKQQLEQDGVGSVPLVKTHIDIRV